MKVWLKQNKRRIFFGFLFCWFAVYVLVIPFLRPHIEPGYWVTYKIDGYNVGDALFRFPFAYLVCGFFCTLLCHPTQISAALYCCYVTAPVILDRHHYFRDFRFADSGFVVLGTVLFYLCFWGIGALLGRLIGRLISVIRQSWKRYLTQKQAGHNAIPDAVSPQRPPLSAQMRAWMTKDRLFMLLSGAVPLVIFVLYMAEIYRVARASAVSMAQDEVDMTYMLIGIPIAYFCAGLLCTLAQKPRYILCGAAVVLLSADTLYGVFDGGGESLFRLPIAAAVYLLFFGVGIVAGHLIRYMIARIGEIKT